MSTPTPQAPSRRARIACLNCRHQKVRCIPSDDSRRGPCARCTQYSLACEYPPIHRHRQDDYYVAAVMPARSNPALQFSQSRPYADQHLAQPSLPYTGPPPMNSAPRYSGGVPYPNLALSDTNPGPIPASTASTAPAHSQPHSQGHYSSHSGYPPMSAAPGYSTPYGSSHANTAPFFSDASTFQTQGNNANEGCGYRHQ